MAVWTSGTTGQSLVANDLPLLDGLTVGYCQAAHVAVQGLDAVPMVQRHRNAIRAVPASLIHFPVGRRADRRAVRSCDVDAIMHLAALSTERVGTPAERRRNETIQWPDGRSLR